MKITIEQFTKDFLSKPAKELAQAYGCSESTVRKKAHKLGLLKNRKLELVVEAPADA